MSTYQLITALGFGGLVVIIVLFILLALGSAIRRRHVDRREVKGPDGVWSTRIHWAHPKAGLGIAERVFKMAPAPKKDDEREEDGRRFRWRDLADGADFFDEVALVIFAVVAALGLIVAALVIVLLAIELAFFLLLFAILGGGRLLFRHPWTIEVIDPHGAKQLVDVEGLNETREAQLQIRQQIAAGTLRLTPRAASL